MRFKKFAMIFLGTMVGISALTGCSQKEETVSKNTEVSTEEPKEAETSEETTASEEVTETTQEDGVVQLPERELSDKKIKLFSWFSADQEGEATEFAYKLFTEEYGGEVESIVTSHEEYYTQLATLIASGLSPDIAYMRTWDWFPNVIINDLAEPVDGMIDFSSPLWKDIEETNQGARWVDGSIYSIITDEFPMTMVYYNIEMFENAGLETPGDLYERGEWTLAKMGELAEEMTIVDASGEVSQVGLSYLGNAPALMGITGEPFIMSENGGFINNIKNPKITQMMNWSSDLAQKKAISSNAWEFIDQKSPMVFFPPHGPGSDFLELTERGIVGVVPYPKWDESSKHNSITNPVGFNIVPGAKNVDAALAFIDCHRYTKTEAYKSQDPTYQEYLGSMSDELKTVNERTIELYNETVKLPATYFKTIFDNDGGMGQLMDGIKTWSTVVEEVSPQIDQRIKEINEK